VLVFVFSFVFVCLLARLIVCPSWLVYLLTLAVPQGIGIALLIGCLMAWLIDLFGLLAGFLCFCCFFIVFGVGVSSLMLLLCLFPSVGSTVIHLFGLFVCVFVC
jgi:hypothetical protein